MMELKACDEDSVMELKAYDLDRAIELTTFKSQLQQIVDM